MRQLKIAVVLAILTLYACQSGQPTTVGDATEQSPAKPRTVADLEKAVLDVHDSIMPAMSDLMKLKKGITQRLTELDTKPASTEVRQLKARGLVLRAELTDADQAMMDWMHHYNGDTLAKLNEPQAMAYLKAQQRKVNSLRTVLQKSITDAQAYLK